MNEDTVVSFRQPGSISADPLTDVLRSGARRLLAQAGEAEVEAHIAAHSDLTDGQGRRRIVRHGYLPDNWGQYTIFLIPGREEGDSHKIVYCPQYKKEGQYIILTQPAPHLAWWAATPASTI